MPQRTDIGWTDYSSNPLKLKLHETGKLVNACIKVSAGCSKCYAESMTRRYWPKVEGKFPGYTPALMKKGDVILNDAEIHKLLTFKPKPPFKNGDRPMLFIEDMSDLFGEFVPKELIDRMFAVFTLRPDITFQVLTKRPKIAAEYLAGHPEARIFPAARRFGEPLISRDFPLPNVWIGTSVEHQAAADKRIPELLKCKAAIHFLSAEPLLGPISWFKPASFFNSGGQLHGAARIDWVIIGAESGSSRRECHRDWIESLVEQCKSADVACFVKQMEVDGRIRTDPMLFPAGLGSQNFPAVEAEAAK